MAKREDAAHCKRIFGRAAPPRHFFFEIRKTEPFPGSPFSDHFSRIFFEKFCIALFLGKILVANYRIVCEVNFAPKAQKFSTDIRKSAVLDAVLEDKSAQPLPCGSYLVNIYREA